MALSPESCHDQSTLYLLFDDQLLQKKTTNAISCEFTGGNTLTNVMPTTSPLLGGDLLKASIDTISASTALRIKTWISIQIIYQMRHKERLRISF